MCTKQAAWQQALHWSRNWDLTSWTTNRERLTRNGDALRLLKSQQPTPTDTSPTRPPSLILSPTVPPVESKHQLRVCSSHSHKPPHYYYSVSILPSQMKQRWSTRLLPLKILFQKLQKKAPTMGIFLLHNLALPPMAWILVKRQFKMPISDAARKGPPGLPKCLYSTFRKFVSTIMKPYKGQPTQEPSPIQHGIYLSKK